MEWNDLEANQLMSSLLNQSNTAANTDRILPAKDSESGTAGKVSCLNILSITRNTSF
jgi:hypothetical protein